MLQSLGRPCAKSNARRWTCSSLFSSRKHRCLAAWLPAPLRGAPCPARHARPIWPFKGPCGPKSGQMSPPTWGESHPGSGPNLMESVLLGSAGKRKATSISWFRREMRQVVGKANYFTCLRSYGVFVTFLFSSGVPLTPDVSDSGPMFVEIREGRPRVAKIRALRARARAMRREPTGSPATTTKTTTRARARKSKSKINNNNNNINHHSHNSHNNNSNN